MNRTSLRSPRSRASSSPTLVATAGILWKSVAAPIFILFALTCIPTAVTASAQFDGNYKGIFELRRNSAGGNCDDSKLEQVMSVAGDRVYLERKSSHPIPLLLSGTIGAEGSITASGVAPSQAANDPAHTATFYTLSGKIENGRFVGALSNRGCDWVVKLQR